MAPDRHMSSICEMLCNEGLLSQPGVLSILDELRCGVVRPRHSANFIRLNGATSLRLVLSVVVTVMSSEICERAADSKSVYGATERIG